MYLRAIRYPLPMRVFLAVCLGLCLIGCGPKSKLDGEWIAAGGNLSPAPGSHVAFKFAGTEVTVRITVESPEIGALEIVALGTFVLEGETFGMQITNVRSDTSKVVPGLKPLIDPRVRPELLQKQFNDLGLSTCKFNPDGTVTITGSATPPITLTKKS